MMIYGIRHRTTARETFPGKCTHCGQIATVEISLLQRYAHFFWIPFFPVGKRGVSRCSHCKEVLASREFSEGYLDLYNQLKQNHRPPLYLYAGLMLLAVLISSGIVLYRQDQARIRKRIDHPKAGDIYSIKEGAEQYTLYKVADVRNDSVYVLFHMLQTDKVGGLGKFKKQDVYGGPPKAFSIGQLHEFHKQNKLLDVD